MIFCIQLHHAFSMYTTGVRVEPCHFSYENAGEIVAIFGTNSQRLTDRHWAQIMASYGVKSTSKGKQKALFNDLLDEQQFCELYIPSSP